MYKQFIGKTFWIVLGAHAVIFLLAALVFQSPISIILLTAIMIATFVMSLHKLEFGLVIVFAELMANSHGHLISVSIDGFPLSLRMGIFISVMCAWLVLILRKKVKISLSDQRLWPFAILGVIVAIGLMNGFLQNDALLVFQDGNAYFYLAYIFPILSVQWTVLNKRMLLQTLSASVFWVILLSLGLLFLYTHLNEVILLDAYTFIRDTRTGEITRMEGGFYRVFMQSQFWVFVFAFLLATYFWVKGVGKKDWRFPTMAFAICCSVILISLSRSFWAGSIIASLTFLGLIFSYTKCSLKKVGAAIGMTVFGKIFAFVLLLVVVLFPFPRQGELIGLSDITSRTGIDDVAVSSRWNLLDPMFESIGQSPIIGHGFGEEIEFITDDPRVREQNPSGKQKTHAFEWGWLELVVKMGLLAPLAFIYLFVSSFLGLQPLLSDKRSWLGIGLITGLVMIYVTHIFSPYLNHPIGLGYLLFLVPFFESRKPLKMKVTVKDILVQQKTATQPKAAVLSRK